jgi:hypothetical protein
MTIEKALPHQRKVAVVIGGRVIGKSLSIWFDF